LNDGLAFPFVYLALHVAAEGTNPALWLSGWLAWDVLYRISVGTVLGIGIGWLLGRVLVSAVGEEDAGQGENAGTRGGVAFTIFASTVIHGLTATATVEALDREATRGRA
jgi:NhaP-type Na+/H+ or K+/H+ antiporter